MSDDNNIDNFVVVVDFINDTILADPELPQPYPEYFMRSFHRVAKNKSYWGTG